MLTQFAISIFFIALLLMFSQELNQLRKKLLGIKGIGPLTPLIFITFLVLFFESFLISAVIYVGILFLSALVWMTQWIPWVGNTRVAGCIFIFISMFLPQILVFYYNRKYPYAPFEYGNLLVLLFWLISVLLFLTQARF